MSRGDVPVESAEWGRRKTRSLLKVLLSARGTVFTVDQLLETLYPESQPERVARNLLTRITELRRALEPGLGEGQQSRYIVRVGRGSYCFAADAPVWIDTERFQAHMWAARTWADQGRWQEATGMYEEAIALYRGDYLAEDLYEEWTQTTRMNLRELYLQALEEAAKGRARQGHLQQATAYSEWLLAADPARESAARLKMSMHHQSGRTRAVERTYAALGEALADLGAGPERVTQDLFRELQATPPAAETHNLPTQQSSFVGRAAELGAVVSRLSGGQVRLLTLTGPGGSGKTRLALEAAGWLRGGAYRDGVWFQSVEGIATPDQLLAALERIGGGKVACSRRQMLVVLDNAEHLPEAADVVATFLGRAPGVRMLVTSRERLKLEAEWCLEIDGLPWREDGPGSAMELFRQRAARVNGAPPQGPREAAAVRRICELVGGLPLAIELAVAWTRVISCQEIARRLEAGLDFLRAAAAERPARHQSLQAVFEHTWAMLTEQERAVLSRLASFQTGFGMAEAAAVGGASASVLAALRDKSVLRMVHPGRHEVHRVLRPFIPA
ncbi:MAG: Transcriptional regulator, LuxR family [Symbiobacteriaceae bacterium]|nr:Transcriptional regulator, LuxR family [Symbiobacteriaceae bacterium]